MSHGPDITAVAALIGDHARAQALTVLPAGKALSATELADGAGVTRQTISLHLARLVDAGLLAVAPVHTGPRGQALRRARACYDHLTGVARTGGQRHRRSGAARLARTGRHCRVIGKPRASP